MRLVLVLFLLLPHLLPAQSAKKANQAREAIMAEATALYHTERAAWVGTDAFLAEYKDQSKIGGYVAYLAGGKAYCIFVSNAATPMVLGTIAMPLPVAAETAVLDLTERPLTEDEFTLLAMRNAAVVDMTDNSFSRVPAGANLNIVPFLYEGKRKVYVLAGPEEFGQVYIGNDYLITLNKKHKVKDREALHNTLLKFPYSAEDGSAIEATVHSHVPGKSEFISVTDVCTLLLYAPYLSWTQHTVISEDYVSILDLEKRSLLIITRAAFDRMGGGR